MDSYRWLLFALMGAALAAVVSVLSKKAMSATDFMVVLSGQCVLMVITLLALTTWLQRWSKLGSTPRRTIGVIALSGVAAGLSWFFGYHALQLSHVAKSTPIDKLSMPLAVLLAVAFLRERPSGLNWVGIGLMLAGALCVAYTPKSG